MLILSVDSASAGCAACVWRDGKVLSVKSEKMERGQDARLMPLVLEAMAAAGISFDELDRIAITRGPGSFTGLRVGLSAARSLGLAANKPVFGVDRFSIYERQRVAGELLTVLDSRRLELFCKPASADEAQLLTPEEISLLAKTLPDLKIAGDAMNILRPVIKDDARFLSQVEEEVVTSAAIVADAESGDEKYLPRPLYLRAPDVTVAKDIGPCASDAS